MSGERKSKRERDAEKRRERRARQHEREQRRLAMMRKRSDDERREHMAQISERGYKPNVGDLVTGAAAEAELARISKGAK